MNERIKDENLIAYCGLYCGDCHGYMGNIPDLARDLRKELRKIHYDKFAHFISTYSFGKDFKNYDDAYKVLGAMVKFRCRRGCRNGGGSLFCKIRKCAQRKGFDGCWECTDFESCEELEFLEPVHGEAHIHNLKNIRNKGEKTFSKGRTEWYKAKKK
jgi:hypothetical protein